MDQLIDAGGMFDPEHFAGDLLDMLRRHLKAGLLVFQKVFDVFYLRQLEEGVELAFCVEKDIQSADLFATGRGKIRGVAFEDMREVHAKPVYLTPPEGVHIVFGHQGTFPLLDPGQLDLFVPVQMWIEMREDILLDNDRFIARHGDSELQNFHRYEITVFADIITGLLIYNKKGLKYDCAPPVTLPDGKICHCHRRWDHWPEQRILSSKIRVPGYCAGAIGFYGQLFLRELRVCLSQSFYPLGHTGYCATGV